MRYILAYITADARIVHTLCMVSGWVLVFAVDIALVVIAACWPVIDHVRALRWRVLGMDYSFCITCYASFIIYHSFQEIKSPEMFLFRDT